MLCNHGAHFFIGRMPETVSSPRIECPVITCFQYSGKRIVIFNNMSSERTVSDIDSSSRNSVYGIVSYIDSSCHLNLNTGHLFLYQSNIMDKIVFHKTLARIKFIFRTGYFIHQLIRNGVFIFKHSRTYSRSISYDTYRTRANLMNIVPFDNTVVDVTAKKNGITAQTGKFAILNTATLRILYKNGCSPINCPVTTQ